jgi:signal transduction histidine kinase
VADNGEGITPEILGTVFSRFASDIPLSDAGGGAGLGLTIARGAAEKHGGALILESRPGEGTIVRATVSNGCPPSGKLRAAEAEYSSVAWTRS